MSTTLSIFTKISNPTTASLLVCGFIALGAITATGGTGELPASAGGADEASTTSDTGSDSKAPAALAFEMKTLEGKDKKLSDWYGDVVLVVNVASRCGLTPQYEQLQALHEKHAKQGLTILAFPCNQFGAQEPGTAEDIRAFCDANYGVEFPVFSKIDVNGSGRCALYKHLTSLDAKPKGKGDISWNFEKFLIGRDGKVIGRYHPRVKPNDKSIVRAIRGALEAPRPADAPKRANAEDALGG